MDSRGKQILQLALETNKNFDDDDDSLSEPYSADSDIDPGFIPSGSSEDWTDNSDSENELDKNMPESSDVFRGKRPRLMTNEYDTKDGLEQVIEEIGGGEIESEQDGLHVEQIENDGQILEEEEGDSAQSILRDLSGSVWGPPQGNHLQFKKKIEGGIKEEWHAALEGQDPIDFFFAFVNFEIIDSIVDQTNIYATQFVMNNDKISNKARAQKWEPTTREEITHLIGLLGYMGIVRMNSIRDYWSQKWLLKTGVARCVMSRNRFQLLLKMLHFSDNEQCPEGNRLYKIQPLLDMLIKNYQTIYTPGEVFCIDETMVPFQGRLLFKQYNPQKTHTHTRTSMVNSHFIFKHVQQSNISINDFRISVIENLLKYKDIREVVLPPLSVSQNLTTHQFTKLDCKARENRKYCKGCYKKKVDGIIKKNKVKKVTTYCLQCEGNPRFCLQCFNSFHKK